MHRPRESCGLGRRKRRAGDVAHSRWEGCCLQGGICMLGQGTHPSHPCLNLRGQMWVFAVTREIRPFLSPFLPEG